MYTFLIIKNNLKIIVILTAVFKKCFLIIRILSNLIDNKLKNDRYDTNYFIQNNLNLYYSVLFVVDEG